MESPVIKKLLYCIKLDTPFDESYRICDCYKRRFFFSYKFKLYGIECCRGWFDYLFNECKGDVYKIFNNYIAPEVGIVDKLTYYRGYRGRCSKYNPNGYDFNIIDELAFNYTSRSIFSGARFQHNTIDFFKSMFAKSNHISSYIGYNIYDHSRFLKLEYGKYIANDIVELFHYNQSNFDKFMQSLYNFSFRKNTKKISYIFDNFETAELLTKFLIQNYKQNETTKH